MTEDDWRRLVRVLDRSRIRDMAEQPIRSHPFYG